MWIDDETQPVIRYRQRRHWSVRRYRDTVILFVEATSQFINLVFILFTCIYVLIKPCGWSDRLLVYSGVVNATCWNTLLLTTLVRRPPVSMSQA